MNKLSNIAAAAVLAASPAMSGAIDPLGAKHIQQLQSGTQIEGAKMIESGNFVECEAEILEAMTKARILGMLSFSLPIGVTLPDGVLEALYEAQGAVYKARGNVNVCTRELKERAVNEPEL